jgi:hypothetical protein
MDWNIVGGITASVTVIMAVHAAIISLVVDRAILRAMSSLNKDYVTRTEFDTHVKRCPHTLRID